MVISIDFDGTICENRYPQMGEPLPNAKQVINYWYDRGHTIIINTCRTGHYEEHAKSYLNYHGIRYNYMNENDPKLIEKYMSDTRKISADVYLDDRTLADVTLRAMMGIEEYNKQYWDTASSQLQYVEKPCIICITAESGAGKSVSAEYLENIYGINLIQSYTDREKRFPEETGHTFLTKKEFDNIGGEQLAFTKFGENRYCCLTNDLSLINTYVIDEDGLVMLRANWSERYDIYSIRLHRPEFDRREQVGDERVDRDKGRFTLKDSEFDYVIVNDENKIETLYNKLENFMKLFRLDGRAKEYDLILNNNERI